jgi:hypothetical protein
MTDDFDKTLDASKKKQSILSNPGVKETPGR